MKRFIAVGCLLLLVLPILAISVSADNSVPTLYLIVDYKYSSYNYLYQNQEIPVSDFFVDSTFQYISVKGIKWYRTAIDSTDIRFSFDVSIYRKKNVTGTWDFTLTSQGYSFSGDYAFIKCTSNSRLCTSPSSNFFDGSNTFTFNGVFTGSNDVITLTFNTPLTIQKSSDASSDFGFAYSVQNTAFHFSFENTWLEEIYDFKLGMQNRLDTIITHQTSIDTNVNTLRQRFNSAVYTPLVTNTFYGRVVSYDSDGRFSYTQTQSDFFQAVVRNQLAIFDIFARNQEKQNEAIDIGLGDLISDGYDTLGSSGVGDLADIFGIFGSAGWDDDAFYNSSSSGLFGWFSQTTMNNIDTVNTPVKGASTHDIITGGNPDIIDFYSYNLDWFNELMGDD